jgi:hypothetical protein
MAYGSFGGIATILRSGPAFQVKLTGAVLVGDLLDKEWTLADASAGGLPGVAVALQDGSSGDVVSVSDWAVIRTPDTIGAGGAVTAGSHGGTLGDTLFLSTTAGDAKEVIDGDGIYQIVGRCISTQDALIQPSITDGDFFEDCEKFTAAKTIDTNDSGKAMVCCSTSDIVITLHATTVGDRILVVNGSQDGDHLTSLSPNSSDGIAGWDFTASDNGDATNTKATSKAGDYLEITADGVSGWQVVSGRGVWAGA